MWKAQVSTDLEWILEEMRSADEFPSAIRAVTFPPDGHLRSRNLISRSNARSTGKFPSWKLRRMVHWESVAELNAFRLLDCDPGVLDYSEQPCKIVFRSKSLEQVHYPDILVTRSQSKEFWEVKHRAEAEESETLERTTCLANALPAWGYEYKAILAEDLARQPRLDNACLLLAFALQAIEDRDWEFMRQAIGRKEPLSWSKACRGAYGPKGRQTLCSLALRGVLSIDLDSPISHETLFVPKEI